MDNHFIKDISIENFKCFQELQLESIERVNLIGGKNNVGKTALLEAVELLVASGTSDDLIISVFRMLKRRQIENTKNRKKYNFDYDFIKKKENRVKISTTNKICAIYFSRQESLFNEQIDFEGHIIVATSLSFSINGDEKLVPIDNRLSSRITSYMENRESTACHINYIGSTKSEEREIAILYSALVDLDRENFLNESLTLFDENIIALKQVTTRDDVILKLKLKNEDSPVLLSSLGEGVNRYIAILCAIWASKDGFLFIDEVENGIHYTNYKKLWQIIFQTSADANCQLFITTHSKECIEAFNEVQFEREDSSGAYFKLYKDVKKDKIAASRRDGEQLNYSLTHKGTFR